MPVADYYSRTALAISQVLAGFDEGGIEERLTKHCLAIAFSGATTRSPEGRALVDLTIRLAARLYPSISLQPGRDANDFASTVAELALQINPRLELESRRKPTIGVRIGPGAATASPTVFAGSSGWQARLSSAEGVNVGSSELAFGAGVAACLAMANVFRFVFMDDPKLDHAVNLSAAPIPGIRLGKAVIPQAEAIALVGLGAIGNATSWALARTPAFRMVHVVDHEAIDLGNLQRYVLTHRSDVDAPKTDVVYRELSPGTAVERHSMRFDEFTSSFPEYRLPTLVALDSARDRRAVQAALPPWIANAWTQPGDLGVSRHIFSAPGACLACLYLPKGTGQSDDQVFAQALGIPDQVMEVRRLLHQGDAVSRPLLDLVAQRLGVDPSLVAPYEGATIRVLYSEGVCGGGILPLGSLGRPRAELHVPLAHQAALAGVLLGARAAASTLEAGDGPTQITRLNVMRELPVDYVTQPAFKDDRGLCICQDRDYQEVYWQKYGGVLTTVVARS